MTILMLMMILHQVILYLQLCNDIFKFNNKSFQSYLIYRNVRSFNDSLSEDQFMTCDENLNISKSTSFSNDARRESLPMKNDGSIDYDGKAYFNLKCRSLI